MLRVGEYEVCWALTSSFGPKSYGTWIDCLLPVLSGHGRGSRSDYLAVRVFGKSNDVRLSPSIGTVSYRTQQRRGLADYE